MIAPSSGDIGHRGRYRHEVSLARHGGDLLAVGHSTPGSGWPIRAGTAVIFSRGVFGPYLNGRKVWDRTAFEQEVLRQALPSPQTGIGGECSAVTAMLSC